MARTDDKVRSVGDWIVSFACTAVLITMVVVWIRYVRGDLGDMPFELWLIPLGAVVIVCLLLGRFLYRKLANRLHE
jgi:hypothetical protein